MNGDDLAKISGWSNYPRRRDEKWVPRLATARRSVRRVDERAVSRGDDRPRCAGNSRAEQVTSVAATNNSDGGLERWHLLSARDRRLDMGVFSIGERCPTGEEHRDEKAGPVDAPWLGSCAQDRTRTMRDADGEVWQSIASPSVEADDSLIRLQSQRRAL